MVIGTPTVLNLIPGKVSPVVNVNQYDAGYQKTFLLYKGSEPFNIATDMAVTIRGTKGDRNGIADSAASTVGSNLVSVTLTEQMTAIAGPNIYELRVADMHGLLVGTVNFVLMVEPAALGDDIVISDSDLNYAADVLDKIQTEEATKNQVDANTAAITQEVIDRTAEDEAIDFTVKQKRGYPLTDLILDGKITSDKYMQGGCYTENGRFVIFIAENATDYGVLQCVDSKTYAVIWTSPRLKLYHANAIAFRPQDRKLYIAACYSESDTSTLLNTVLVVDYDAHQSVENTITSPAPGGIYSLAYDRDTDTFYSTNYRGTTEGQANALYEYNGVFDSVKRVIVLDDLTVRGAIASSSQGVQCVVDGIAYIPYYSPQKCIVGYSLTNGARVSVSNLGRTTNDFKNIGEPEFVAFDGVDFYFGFMSVNTGIPGHVFWDICKVGIYHNIVVNSKLPSRPAVSNDQWNTITFTLDLTKPDLRPTNLTGIFYNLTDCVRYQNVVGIYFVVQVKNTSAPNDLMIGHIYASEFNATIRPLDTTKKLKVENAFFSASKIIWQYCSFIGDAYVSPSSSIKANIVVARKSDFDFTECTFPEVSGNTHAIYVMLGAKAVADFKKIATSYFAVGATEATIMQKDSAALPTAINPARVDISRYTVVHGLMFQLLSHTFSVGGSTTLNLINAANLLLRTPFGISENALSTSQGVGYIYMTDMLDSGYARRAKFKIDINNNTITLEENKLLTPDGVTQGGSVALTVFQRGTV